MKKLYLASCVFFILFSCTTTEMSDTEKELLLTVEYFADYGYEFENQSEYEVFEKVKYIDGALELNYDFELPEVDTNYLYVSVSLSIEKTVEDAEFSYKAVGLGTKVAGLMDLEYVEVPDYSYGDESEFKLLVVDDYPFGNMFRFQKGTYAFFIMVAGIYFDDAEIWEDFIGSYLEYLDDEVSLRY